MSGKGVAIDVHTIEYSGPDEEVAALCAKKVPRWDDLSRTERTEMAFLQRRFSDLVITTGLKGNRARLFENDAYRRRKRNP